jgi:ribosomal protein S18 acetylase RimI-like enzyme
MAIRVATVADAAALLSIENASFSSDKIKARQMRYLLTQAKAFSLVFIESANIVGYCTVLTPAFPRPARIYSLAVDENFRGKKIASSLLQQAIDTARAMNYTSIRLEVRAEHLGVQALYQGLGFSEIGRIEAYYEDGEQAIHMQKFL